MSFGAAEYKKLALPFALAILFCAAGAVLIWQVERALVGARAKLTAFTTDRTQARERLARISEEEREVKEKIEIYRQLKTLNIIGPERRLEWVDAIQRIRTSRELLDLRYRIEPRKLSVSLPGKPANVDFFESRMKVEIALLHEGDLFAFLGDLRDAGNAYVAVRSCSLQRSGQGGASPPGLVTLVPRLRAECQIDLITIFDRGAKA